MKTKTVTILKITAICILIAALMFGAGLFTGYLLYEPFGETPAETSSAQKGQAPKTKWWTCSMHPQIRLPKPGKCPQCFMDLIPLEDEGDEEGAERRLTVTEAAKRLMEIDAFQVHRRFVEASVRMTGKVAYDETRLSHITAWVPGRLDRLFADYTGVPVQKGDHMVSIYSPELLSAQQELLQAMRTAEELAENGSPVVSRSSKATVEAAREKLRLLGLTSEQVEQIEERGTVEKHVTIYAPSGGIVIEKHVQEGVYVKTGARIYTIADLSRVWVILDAYESDLAWLRYGQHVDFTAESYPGEKFSGVISFIQPVLDEETRTVKVRVNVPNPDGRLKPGMFVRAVAKAKVATGGRVLDAALAGKWISPMHPEIVKDAPGTCDVCGMPLVKAETLGYVGTGPTDADKPLVIPVSAPLITGRRAVVYVEVPDRDRPTYEGREVAIGPKAGEWYIVKEGLSEGEWVVKQGAFKLDAELQIRAGPSMMMPGMPAEKVFHEKHAKNAVPRELHAVLGLYLDVQSALVAGKESQYKGPAEKAAALLGHPETAAMHESATSSWKDAASTLKSLFASVASSENLAAARTQYALLSEQLADVVKRFQAPDGPWYKVWCPMAFDNRGAWWIQKEKEIANPYFGDAMLRCGEIKEVLE